VKIHHQFHLSQEVHTTSAKRLEGNGQGDKLRSKKGTYKQMPLMVISISARHSATQESSSALREIRRDPSKVTGHE